MLPDILRVPARKARMTLFVTRCAVDAADMALFRC